MSTPAKLRIALLALLAIAVLLPSPGRDPAAGDVVARPGNEEALARLLLADAPPGLLVRSSAEPPTDREMELLEALGERSALVAARPDAAPALRLEPPARLREGRWGALGFTVRGEPGDTVEVSLLEAGVAVDSLRLSVEERGEARGAFRLRPASAGWHQWEVEAAGLAGSAGAWVAAGPAPRVLLASGPPTWESRFAARALEEAGVVVSVTQSLGRGLRVGGSFPATLEELAGYNAVLLLSGAPLNAARLRLLERYAAEAGGGVLVAGAEEALPALGLAEGVMGGGAVKGEGIGWALPAELFPLPATPTESAVEVLEAPRPGALAVAHLPGGAPVMAVRALGRGRAAALGLRETWRWRLEGGRVEEHRDFWRAAVDWLAAGQRSPLALHLPTTRGATGGPVDVWVYGDAADTVVLRLLRPDGSTERLPAAAVEPGVRRATFLPLGAGLHSLQIGWEEGGRARLPRHVRRGGGGGGGPRRLGAPRPPGRGVRRGAARPGLRRRLGGAVGGGAGGRGRPDLLPERLAGGARRPPRPRRVAAAQDARPRLTPPAS